MSVTVKLKVFNTVESRAGTTQSLVNKPVKSTDIVLLTEEFDGFLGPLLH